LDHEKSLVVSRALWPYPIIPCIQVLPHRVPCGHRLLTINEKKWQFTSTRIPYSCDEKIEGLRTPFAANDAGHASRQTSGLKKRLPSLSKEAVI
jgi:hypothetical protein